MKVLIDAQTIQWYHHEKDCAEQNEPPEKGFCEAHTGCATDVLNLINRDNPIVVDDGKQIHQDWQDTVGEEWLSHWYTNWLIKGLIMEIPAGKHRQTCERLLTKGFPSKGRDMWYIRTAKSLRSLMGEATIVTEDMDFHEPTKKKTNHKERMKILLSGNGTIAHFLRRKEDIHIKCIRQYVSDYRQE